jgi:hypothetical protein
MNAPVEQQLRELPELEPRVDAWQRVRRVARRERRAAIWRRFWPVAMTGGLTAVAAGLALLVVVLEVRGPEVPALPPARLDAPAAVPEIIRLQAKSQALESMLQSLPGRPRLVRADDAAAIAALEDRIAHVDWQLTRSSVRDTAPLAAPSLWRERVDLMDQLVRVRYAEAGVSAY